MFFEGRDEIHKTMRRLTKRLDKAGIRYVIVGAMAVNFHQHRRTTDDVDILLTQHGLDEFRKLFVPKKYQQETVGRRRFIDRINKISIDILVSGHFPGSGEPGPVAFPDPAKVTQLIGKTCVVDLVTLVQMKLAARRHYDFGDVANLIRVHDLNESFLKDLHPSLHQDFIECLEEKRRDDLYHARSAQLELESQQINKNRYQE